MLAITGQYVFSVGVPKDWASTTVRFSAPGTYVLRAYADDGILVATKDVTVNVVSAAAR